LAEGLQAEQLLQFYAKGGKEQPMPTEQDYRRALIVRHPFWEKLSPTVIKQRVAQILAAPNSQALVQALSPVEYTVILKESPETRSALLKLAHPKQIRTVLDLDCWHKDTLQSTQVLAWLEELHRSGHDVFIQALQELDTELLIATFCKHIRVHAALPLEEETESHPYNEVLANELYRVEFLDQEDPLYDRILQLLSALRMADLDFYHGLMQSIMWGQVSEAEEWAYRWKSGRLQDEGFPDYYEALEMSRLVDLEQPLPASTQPPQAPGLPESAEESGLVPTYAWSLTPSGSLLAQALTAEFTAETQERLCWEMVYLCNRELVIDQVDFANAAAVRASLARVHAHLNMGLEYLSDNAHEQLVSLLTDHSLQSIYQVGFTLSMRLHQQALRLQAHLDRAAGVRRALPGLAQQVLVGLLDKHPQFFEGLEYPGAIAYRDFLHMRDVMLAAPVLTYLENDPAYCVPRPAP
jgi:hypothetical protein